MALLLSYLVISCEGVGTGGSGCGYPGIAVDGGPGATVGAAGPSAGTQVRTVDSSAKEKYFFLNVRATGPSAGTQVETVDSSAQ